jgi:cell cycle sensor histidine kinase DivJ
VNAVVGSANNRGEAAADAVAATPRPPGDPELRWQLGWAVGALGSLGILLIAVGRPSVLAMLAMLIIGLPSLIGAIWRPRGRQKAVYLGVWALAAAMATTLEGGLGGPLAVWCVMPAIATIVIEAPWLWGVALSGGALLVVACTNALHLAWRAPHQPLTFWLSLIAVLTTAGGAVGGLAVARRRAKAMRAEVEAELSAFQALMGDLPELALAMDQNGRTQAIFGQPVPGVDTGLLHDGLVFAADEADRPKVAAAVAEALGQGWSRVVFTPAAPGALKLVAALQRTSTGGLTAILREAPPTPVRIAMKPVAGSPSEAQAGLALPVSEVVLDLNRRLREAEAGRKKAEDEATGRARFLANMSHELRTPLNAIMGFSDIMRTRMFGELQPKYLEYAELIHESGHHLLDLINDVLDMSKIEAQRYELSREVFDVRDAVNAALRLLRLQADEAGVKLRGVLPAEPVEVDADRRAIKQIVLNLVANALKFTPAGGMVTVTADKAAGQFELLVSDTGVGIAPEDLERLGRPYEQAGGMSAKAQGTGLGLSLVRSFSELHGGSMGLESRLGEGTAVTVRLPVLVESPVAAAPEALPVADPAPELELETVAGPVGPPFPKVVPGGVPDA